MNPSRVFIRRPVATVLLTLGLFLLGLFAFIELPVAPLPQVDFPTISVSASLPGASAETMAATVATPLERALGSIADVSEMTSSSSLGSTRVTLQFNLSRNIDGAAREVQAAINAARATLPSSLPRNPTYRKINPADQPIVIVALTSDRHDRAQLYDLASTLMAQRIAQLSGVGNVDIGGGAAPAVRVRLNLAALNQMGLSLEAVRTAIGAANLRAPVGSLDDGTRSWLIATNDQLQNAEDYRSLILRWQNGTTVRLADIADVADLQQDIYNLGLANGKPAVLLQVQRQPGANILDTVEAVKAQLPGLQAALPPGIEARVVLERTPSIKASLRDVERSLLLSVVLVVGVVFVFLRNARATLIPLVAVPVSLVGTFAIMYLLGYTLNILSLMALTVATGFVVDDAVVVLENGMRHIERGQSPLKAALRGAREVGFTVLSMSLSLVVVFLPIIALGGIVGRFFREFAITLSVAVLISMLVSLTTTPMMCAYLLRRKAAPLPAGRPGWTDRALTGLQNGYRRSLDWALRHTRIMMAIFFLTIAANVWLYVIVPKGFFPDQDVGILVGGLQADQSSSFESVSGKLQRAVAIIGRDPAVQNVMAFTGGSRASGGSMFVVLKPLDERKTPAAAVINRLRPKLARVAGASVYLQSASDIRLGGRPSDAAYQYTLQSDDLQLLRQWEPTIRAALSQSKALTDVNTDTQEKGAQTRLTIDRDALARLGLSMHLVDATLNDAFGQRQVSNIYKDINQYTVVMEAAPQYLTGPQALAHITLVTAAGKIVPLSAIARWEATRIPLSVNHEGGFAASTVSFNLAEGVSLGQATDAINDALARIGVPSNIKTGFGGNAGAFEDTLKQQPIMILAAVLAIYILLGILYESALHPLTILSTLPSAGLGALLALQAFGSEFSIIAMIGVILLVGIVQKNAIMLIDVAIDAERRQGLSPLESIRHACELRLRPILMTTVAALFGALPLALGTGNGAEMRQPLGIAIVGGLLVSQLITLYTTPVVYLVLDRWRRLTMRRTQR
ncbi:MAG: multidrug efflux RND transporter permease subunit [Burkholderiaceae bacterium]